MKKKDGVKNIAVNRNIHVKLPNLVITKFKGTHLNWF